MKKPDKIHGEGNYEAAKQFDDAEKAFVQSGKAEQAGIKLLRSGAHLIVTAYGIERDMSELVPSPVAVKAAILGFPDGGDRVLEVIEYPRAPGRPPRPDPSVTDSGFTHVGLVCDDIAETRAELEDKGVRFLTRGTAEIVGLRTTWFADPHGLVFILLEKRELEKPYFAQY